VTVRWPATATRSTSRSDDDNIIDFPGEFLTELGREQNRWTAVAFCALCIAGRAREDQ
jgi:hypothetical protein